jgi:hypothetical protein
MMTPQGIFRRMMPGALVIGAIGLIATLAGMFLGLPGAYPAYLFAFVFWTGMGIGSLLLALLQHLTRSGWGAPIQRFVEAGARTLPLMLVLFIPIMLAMKALYSWADPAHVIGDPILEHKQPYLNVPFFIVRTVIYFAVWTFFAYRTGALSLKLDATGDVNIAGTLRGMGAGGLLAVTLTASFAAFDWVMSLEPHWMSSIFGLMVTMGMMLGAFALAVALAAWASDWPPLDAAVSPRRFNDLGSLMLAFVMIWAYLSFSQYMLIWAANLAEEVPWYLVRMAGGWKYIAIAIIALHFALPFVMLMFRDVKRNRRLLAAIALFLVLMRAVDTFWLVIPSLGAAGVGAIWPHLTALVGIGGLWAAFFTWNLARAPLLPVGLPAPLQDSAVVSEPHHNRIVRHER